MRRIWVLISALGLATLAGHASAAPSFFGPTGLLVIPTADSLAKQSWNAGVHAIDAAGTPTTFGANYGITSQLEFGVTGYHVSGFGTKALVNAKYVVLPESAKVPGVAVGGIDIANQLPGTDPGVYAVASKSLSSLLGGGTAAKYNLRGHVGYGAHNIFNSTVFGGADLQLSPKLQAMVEVLDGNIYAGGRFGLGKGVRAELGSYDGRFGGGVSYAATLP